MNTLRLVLRVLLRRPAATAWALVAALAGLGILPGPALDWAANPPPLIIPPVSANVTPKDAYTLAAGLTGSISTEANDTRYVADKDVVFDISDKHLNADHLVMQLDPQTRKLASIEVSGEVKLTMDALRVLTQKATYDAQKNALTADQLRAGKAPFNIEGGSVSGTDGRIAVNDFTFYYGEPDPYVVNIHARSATYDSGNETVRLDGATFRVGTIPFFYLPSYTQGQTDQPPVSTQMHFGYRSDLGGYGRSTTFLTKDPEFEPGLLLDEYSYRGPLAGPAFKYDYLANPDWLQTGTFESGFIHDTGDRGLDVNNNPVPENRFFADWLDKSSVGGMFDLTNSMYWWSDSNVLRDYRQNDWQNNQLPDNFIEAVNRQEDSFASVFARYEPNNFEAIQQRLPEIRYDLMPMPLGNTGIYQEGQASYVQLNELSFNGTAAIHSNRADAYYGWRVPINLTSWATITPVAGGRVTDYMDTLTNQGQFTRVLGQVGFDSEIRSLGRWDVNAPAWGIDGIQHILRPVLEYRYIPQASQGAGLIPVMDADTFSPYPPILDLNDTRSVDQLYSTNVMRYGIENLFQTRGTGYGTRDLGYFNIYNDVHFQRTDGENTFSDLWTSLGLTPANWINLGIYNRVDPQALTQREIHSYLKLIDGDQWNATLFTDNLQHQSDQYGLEVEYRLSERNQLGARWRYDQNLGALTEQTYFYRTRLGDTWSLQYEVSYFRGTLNQNGIAFNVRVELLTY